jgi:hypothetical protein
MFIPTALDIAKENIRLLESAIPITYQTAGLLIQIRYNMSMESEVK